MINSLATLWGTAAEVLDIRGVEGLGSESFGRTAANISLIVASVGLKGAVERTEETGGNTFDDPEVVFLLPVEESNVTTPGEAEEEAG